MKKIKTTEPDETQIGIAMKKGMDKLKKGVEPLFKSKSKLVLLIISIIILLAIIFIVIVGRTQRFFV